MINQGCFLQLGNIVESLKKCTTKCKMNTNYISDFIFTVDGSVPIKIDIDYKILIRALLPRGSEINLWPRPRGKWKTEKNNSPE